MTVIITPNNLSESTSKSTSLNNRVSGNFSVEQDGSQYIIWWYAELYGDAELYAEIVLDSTTLASTPSGVTTAYNFSGVRAVTLDKGTYNVYLKYKSSSTTEECKIKNAQIVIRKH